MSFLKFDLNNSHKRPLIKIINPKKKFTVVKMDLFFDDLPRGVENSNHVSMRADPASVKHVPQSDRPCVTSLNHGLNSCS